MSVQFEEENFDKTVIRRRIKNRQPKLVRLVLKLGLAKTEKGANAVLLIISILSLLATGVIIYTFFFKTGPKTTLRDIPPEIREQLPPEVLEQIPRR